MRAKDGAPGGVRPRPGSVQLWKTEHASAEVRFFGKNSRIFAKISLTFAKIALNFAKIAKFR